MTFQPSTIIGISQVTIDHGYEHHRTYVTLITCLCTDFECSSEEKFYVVFHQIKAGNRIKDTNRITLEEDQRCACKDEPALFPRLPT